MMASDEVIIQLAELSIKTVTSAIKAIQEYKRQNTYFPTYYQYPERFLFHNICRLRHSRSSSNPPSPTNPGRENVRDFRIFEGFLLFFDYLLECYLYFCISYKLYHNFSTTPFFCFFFYDVFVVLCSRFFVWGNHRQCSSLISPACNRSACRIFQIGDMEKWKKGKKLHKFFGQT